MSGPPVQLVARTESIEMLKNAHSIFFIYVGIQNGVFWDTYYASAKYFQPHGFFYATSKDLASQHFELEYLPTVIVYKEESHFHYPHSNIISEMNPLEVNETLHHWVNVERFTSFPKITRFNIHQLMKTKKWLALAIVEENKLSEIATHELEFRDMIESVVRKHRDKYHENFQFGWVCSVFIQIFSDFNQFFHF